MKKSRETKSGKRPKTTSIVDLKCEYGFDNEVRDIALRLRIQDESSGMIFDGRDMPREFRFVLKQRADATLLKTLLSQFFTEGNVKHSIEIS